MGLPYTNRRDFITGAASSAAISAIAGLAAADLRANPTLTIGVPDDMMAVMRALGAMIQQARIGFSLELKPLGGHSLVQFDLLSTALATCDVVFLDVVFGRALSSKLRPMAVGEDFFVRALATCPQDGRSARRFCAPLIVNPGMLLRKIYEDRPRVSFPPALSDLVADSGRHWVAQMHTTDDDGKELMICNFLELAAACEPALVGLDGGMRFEEIDPWRSAVATIRRIIRDGGRLRGFDDPDRCFTEFRRWPEATHLRTWAKNYTSYKLHQFCPPMTMDVMHSAGNDNGVLGGLNVAVSKKSRHTDLALRFATALTEAPLQTLIAAHGFAPARLESYSADMTKAYKHLGRIPSAMRQCLVRPAGSEYATYLTLMSGLAETAVDTTTSHDIGPLLTRIKAALPSARSAA